MGAVGNQFAIQPRAEWLLESGRVNTRTRTVAPRFTIMLSGLLSGGRTCSSLTAPACRYIHMKGHQAYLAKTSSLVGRRICAPGRAMIKGNAS